MPSGADRCLATEPSRSTTPWCGTLNREHELQRRPITLTARVHNALDKPRSFTDAALALRTRDRPCRATAGPARGESQLQLVLGSPSMVARNDPSWPGPANPNERATLP